MALESGTYINSLNASNPTITDQIDQGDDHIRLIKSTIKNTFTNITGQVTVTQTDLNKTNQIDDKAPINGAQLTGSPTLDESPADGDNSTKIATTAFVNANGVPAGAILMWSGTHATIPGGWALCDGNNGTPNLVNKFVVCSAGDIVPPGSYEKGSTGGTSNYSIVTGGGGGHDHGGSTGGHALTEAQMPKHYHEMVGPHSVTAPQGGTAGYGKYGGGTPDDTALRYGTWSTGGGAVSGGTSTGTGNGNSHSHSISSVADHGHTVQFDNRPPYYALAFIMKLAPAS